MKGTRLRSLAGRKSGGITVTPATKPADVGMPVWWWIPGRSRAATPDSDFVKRLKSVDENLDVGWNPEDRCWEIWYKSGQKQVPWANGWKRLFQVTWSQKLDNRVFWVLHERDNTKFGGAVAWFDQVEAERARERERKKAAMEDDSVQMAREYWEYTKIKSSSHGGKFVRHHAGG